MSEIPVQDLGANQKNVYTAYPHHIDSDLSGYTAYLPPHSTSTQRSLSLT